MNENDFQVEQAPEGGYTARAQGHSIFTDADAFDALRDMARDAVRRHFDEDHGSRLIRLHFVHDEVLAAWGRPATSPKETKRIGTAKRPSMATGFRHSMSE